MTLFDLLNQRKFLALFLVVSGGFFALNYRLIARLPGGKHLACEIGGGLTPENLTFAFIMSAMTGLLIMGFISLLTQKARLSWKTGSTTTFGMAVGILSTFCTLCTLPLLSLFGVGVVLSFMAEYELWFKGVSLLLLGGSVYLMNQQLKQQCQRCVR